MNKLIQCFSVVILAAVTTTAIATTQTTTSPFQSAVSKAATDAQSQATAAQQAVAKGIAAQMAAEKAYINANAPCINSILAQIPIASKSCQNDTQQCIGPGNPSYSPQQCRNACNNAINTLNSNKQLKVNGQVNGSGPFNASTANPNDNNIDECNFCSMLMYQDSHGVNGPSGCSITAFKAP